MDSGVCGQHSHHSELKLVGYGTRFAFGLLQAGVTAKSAEVSWALSMYGDWSVSLEAVHRTDRQKFEVHADEAKCDTGKGVLIQEAEKVIGSPRSTLR